MRIILLISLLSFLSGCFTPTLYNVNELSERGRYIRNVPFFPQEVNYCGPSTMASVLNYWGYQVSLDEVAGKIYTPKLNGTITIDMMNYAKGAGFYAAWAKGSINQLKKEIESGHPLILYLDLGYSALPAGHPTVSSGHYIVVVGYDDEKKGIIVYSGEDKDLFIPYNKLHKVWGKTGFWTLLILPKAFKGEK